MNFEIDFNREPKEFSYDQKMKIFENIGAKIENRDEHSSFIIEINNLVDLQILEKKVNESTGKLYSLIVGFDPPTIFLDKDI